MRNDEIEKRGIGWRMKAILYLLIVSEDILYY